VFVSGLALAGRPGAEPALAAARHNPPNIVLIG